jgi:hypothetical protein
MRRCARYGTPLELFPLTQIQLTEVAGTGCIVRAMTDRRLL